MLMWEHLTASHTFHSNFQIFNFLTQLFDNMTHLTAAVECKM